MYLWQSIFSLAYIHADLNISEEGFIVCNLRRHCGSFNLHLAMYYFLPSVRIFHQWSE